MIKFVNSFQKNPNVEDVMRDINNYIIFHDDSVVGSSLKQVGALADYNHLLDLMTNVNNDYTLSPYTPTVSGGKLAKVKSFFNKIIRKCTSWYMKDLCNQQTCINGNIIRVLNEQTMFIHTLMEENAALKKSVNNMQESMINREREDKAGE